MPPLRRVLSELRGIVLRAAESANCETLGLRQDVAMFISRTEMLLIARTYIVSRDRSGGMEGEERGDHSVFYERPRGGRKIMTMPSVLWTWFR